MDVDIGDVEVDCGLFQIAVSEQHLNCSEVSAGLQQVCGKAVPQGIIAMLMNFTQRRSAIVITLSTA